MGETIRVEHITKQFRGHTVLDDVSLACESGRIYGIVGYNGSGKTVLFKCICGFYFPDRGDIYIRGKKMGRRYDPKCGRDH